MTKARGRRQDAAGDLDEPGPDEVAESLGVGHDPGEERARLRLVEVGDRQPADVALDPAAHFGDRALRGLAEDLGQRERRDRLDERRAAGGQDEHAEELAAALADHLVEEELRRAGQDQPAESVDGEEPEAEASRPLRARRAAPPRRAGRPSRAAPCASSRPGGRRRPRPRRDDPRAEDRRVPHRDHPFLAPRRKSTYASRSGPGARSGSAGEPPPRYFFLESRTPSVEPRTPVVANP